MWHTALPASDIADGEYKSIEIDDIPLLVFNLQGEYFALEDRCTHDDAELDGGAIEDGCIKCPRHGACFDIRTGAAKSAPAYEPTDAFEVRTNEAGQLEIDID